MAKKKIAKKLRTSKKGSRKTEEELISLVRRKARRYLRLPNVTSVGVGYRIRDNQETDELSIQFTVGKKLGPEIMAINNITPLPETITADDGTEIPVDVIERSYGPSYGVVEESGMAGLAPEDLNPEQIRRSRLDTIMPGVSPPAYCSDS